MSKIGMFLQKLKKILLHGSSFKLRAYEQAALDAWRERLPEDGRALLDAQLKHLVSYQRQAGGKLLGFFSLENKPSSSVPQETLFPCRLGECNIVRIHLAPSGKDASRNKVRAQIILHRGRISLIEFNQPPDGRFANGVEVAKVEILRDPMIPASEETVSDEQRREEALKSVRSKLPDEYLQLVGDGKSVLVNDWLVCVVQDIRKIPQRDANYYLLAEKEGFGAIGVKEDEWSGQVYYLDYGDDRGERLTVSLRKFFEGFDGGKVVGRF